MTGVSKVSKVLEKAPIDKDDMMAYGVSLFLNELDPDDIKISWYENGWELTVKTDEESTEKMKEFWQNNITDKL